MSEELGKMRIQLERLTETIERLREHYAAEMELADIVEEIYGEHLFGDEEIRRSANECCIGCASEIKNTIYHGKKARKEWDLVKIEIEREKEKISIELRRG